MPLTAPDFDSISQDDLQELIDSGVQEGARIDYKRDAYGRSDQDKREFLKDLSSFANTLGGHLIIGMDESEGSPISLTPLTRNPDEELQWLESLARDAIEPRISGIRMKAIPIHGGGFVIVARVPRSWNVPHRTSFKGGYHFYARSAAGAYEMSLEELRSGFVSSATAFERALAQRDRRLEAIDENETTVTLAGDGGRVAIHIVPLGSTGESVLDLAKAREVSQLLAPLGATEGWSPQYNFDGFAVVRPGPFSHGYTQLFRDGLWKP